MEPGMTGVLVLVGGIVGLALLIAGAALAFAWQRSRLLDPAFAALGIPGSGAIPNVREYHGHFAGRALDALYLRRGGILEITLSAGLRTRATLTHASRPPAERFFPVNESLWPTCEPAWLATGDEPAWIDALCRDPAARDALGFLLHDPTGTERRRLQVRGGALVLQRAHLDAKTAGPTIAPAVQALGALAYAAERLPPPVRPLDASALEAQWRKSPTRLVWLMVGGIMAMLLLLSAILVAALLHSDASSSGRPATTAAPPAGPGPASGMPRKRTR